jgi:hypothetical protein
MPGFYFQIPFLDRVAFKMSRQEQTLIIKDLRCQTMDGVSVLIDSIFIFQIQDPVKAAYEAVDYVDVILIRIAQSYSSRNSKSSIRRNSCKTFRYEPKRCKAYERACKETGAKNNPLRNPTNAPGW